MWDIITKPLEKLGEAKKEKNIKKTLLVQLVGVIMFALSLIFFALGLFFFKREIIPGIFVVAILSGILVYVLLLLFALVLKHIMGIFAGKKDYFAALTPMAYSLFIFSTGLLIASILALIPTFVGPLLALFVMLYTLAVSQPVWVKGTMELFDVDAITVVIAYVILIIAFTLALSIATTGRFLEIVQNFPGVKLPF